MHPRAIVLQESIAKAAAITDAGSWAELCWIQALAQEHGLSLANIETLMRDERALSTWEVPRD